MTDAHSKAYGKLIEEFTVDRANMVMRFIIATTIFSVCITIILLFPVALFVEEEKPTSEEALYIVIGILACCGFMVIGFLSLRSVLHTIRNKPKVILYEEAIVYRDQRGETSIRWMDIATYENTFFSLFVTLGALTLVSKFGTKIQITWIYENPSQLTTFVRQEVAMQAVPELIEKLKRGETLRFGNVKLSPNEVTDGILHFEWDTITNIEFVKSPQLQVIIVENDIYGKSHLKLPYISKEADLLVSLLHQKDQWLDHVKGQYGGKQ